MTVAVLAVDGGNSKTDVALVDGDGRLLARVRGPSVSHQVVGARAGAERLTGLVDEAHRIAAESPGGVPVQPRMAIYCLAGADFPSDVRLIRRELERLSLAEEEVVMNDCFAALRAGAHKGWGVVLICGQGINGAGIGPDGRVVRFAGIGDLSGDWGGGGGLGREALAAAIRARDGRGARTSLEGVVAKHFHLRTPEAVMLAMYEHRLPSARLNELAPAVFAEAESGDPVARSIVDRLADELAAMGTALMRRLHVTRQEVDVVLAGGVFNTRHPGFYARLAAGINLVAPKAQMVRPSLPPVGGAALLALDRISPTGKAPVEASTRLAADFAKHEV